MRLSGLSGAGVVALAIAVWEIACRIFPIPPFVLPAPSAIWMAGWEFGSNWSQHFFATLSTVLAGFLVAVLIGIPLAIAIAQSPVAYRAIYPFLVIKQSIPIVALAPIIVIVAGAGMVAKVIVAALVAVFPIVVSTATGLKATPSEYLDLARSIRDDRLRELIKVRFPMAARHVFSGLRVAITLAVIGAVVAEFVSAGKGLGYIVYSSMAYLKTSLAFAALALLAVIGLTLFYGLGFLQKWLCPWAPESAETDADVA